ncbi:hypothetical protein AQUCO_00100558v1 [Aquilegia coerulea]|uniref:Uncharacterized protein n=1 Tax=Aquilegia coerulea TaxID=218851 RepID=A0A2G5FAT1_AQUCA|nr:hypothetical protein AQUCO_00100558v1 [Aquilegia coerulea]
MVKGGAVLNKDGVSGTVYFTPRKRWPNYSDWDSLVSKLGFMVFTSMPLATQQTGACQQVISCWWSCFYVLKFK